MLMDSRKCLHWEHSIKDSSGESAFIVFFLFTFPTNEGTNLCTDWSMWFWIKCENALYHASACPLTSYVTACWHLKSIKIFVQKQNVKNIFLRTCLESNFNTGTPNAFKQPLCLTGDAELLGTKRSFYESCLWRRKTRPPTNRRQSTLNFSSDALEEKRQTGDTNWRFYQI